MAINTEFWTQCPSLEGIGGARDGVRGVAVQEEGRWVTLDLRTARGSLATLIGGSRRIV